LFKLIFEPISVEFNCGIDAKYDDIYLSIESEIDKINSPIEGSKTDWSFIIIESEKLLLTRTKDIKLLCWWAYAQFKVNGLKGFFQGISTINQLLKNFGKDLFPKSNRAKLGAISWFETVMNLQLIQDRQISVSIDDSESYLELFHIFQEHVKKVCEDDVRLFSEACRLLEVKVSDKKRRDEAEKPKISVPLTSTGNTSSDEITNDSDAIKVLNHLKKNDYYLIC